MTDKLTSVEAALETLAPEYRDEVKRVLYGNPVKYVAYQQNRATCAPRKCPTGRCGCLRERGKERKRAKRKREKGCQINLHLRVVAIGD